jgi:hypothetical protein
VLLGVLLALSGCSAKRPSLGSMNSDQALRECHLAFEDFIWTHDIDGTISITVPPETAARAKPESLDCMEKWAAAVDQPHEFHRPEKVISR